MNKKVSTPTKAPFSRSKDKTSSKKTTSRTANTSKSKTQLQSILLEDKQKSSIDYTMYATPLRNSRSQKKKQKGNEKAKSKTTKCVYSSKNDRSGEDPRQRKGRSKREEYQSAKFQEITSKKQSQWNSSKETIDRKQDKSPVIQAVGGSLISPLVHSHNISRQESQRLQKLRKHLHESTDRIQNIKKLSDTHVLDQFSISQQNLNQCLHEAETQIATIKTLHKQELEKISHYYESIIEQNNREIDSLKLQLTEERTSKVKGDVKVKQNQVLVRCMKQKLGEKELMCQGLEKALKKEREGHRELKERYIRCLQEKEQIRRQAEQVLEVVREQIRQKTAQMTSQL